MNKDQAKGVARDIAGKVQETAGELTGNNDQQIKGLGKQIAGKAEKALGDVKEVIKDATAKPVRP
ncbi:MAG: CsbD family protein [Betaproteobacteria bacterium]|nr:CsbD family protein [Betaproteobacteria bacterium]